MKGIKISLGNIKTNSTFDMILMTVKLIIISKNLTLSKTEIQALTYFIINGYNDFTKNELITTKLLKSKKAVDNLCTYFRKYGILVKNSLGEKISSDFDINAKDLDGILLEITIKK